MNNFIELPNVGEIYVYSRPQRLLASTPIMDYRGQTYYVKNFLEATNAVLEYLKEIDSKNEEKYKQADLVLKGIVLLLENQRSERPNKKQMEYLVDVLEEFCSKKAGSEEEKKYNEHLAELLKIWINLHIRE